jgi:uncharacterized protein YbdZ (MbtH family)
MLGSTLSAQIYFIRRDESSALWLEFWRLPEGWIQKAQSQVKSYCATHILTGYQE